MKFMIVCIFSCAMSGCGGSADRITVREELLLNPTKLILVERSEPRNLSPLLYASYLRTTGVELIKATGDYSADGGKTWKRRPEKQDLDSSLPWGYRRDRVPLFVDPDNSAILMLIQASDTPGLDPAKVEPIILLRERYLRYRVSLDHGQTYSLDLPVHDAARSVDNPFDGIFRGKGCLMIGDTGSRPIKSSRGTILVPAQTCKIDERGELEYPAGRVTSYTEVLVIRGHWQSSGKIDWTAGQRIAGDPTKTSRGLFEPTIIELHPGTLLSIMRGSNEGSRENNKLPSYKWMSVSRDDGLTWSTPSPWTYSNGEKFYSPSSMSQLIRHSSGRVLWIGNITDSNPVGNSPRWPLVIGEVNSISGLLRAETVIVLDSIRPGDSGLNLSHWWAIEERGTGIILVLGARYSGDYSSWTPVIYKVAVK